MNQLSFEKRTQLTRLLVEGNSLRATSRIADVAFNSVLKFVPLIGSACQKFHDETVVKVPSRRVQCDEIWSFVYSKEKNVPAGMEGNAGDIWTWVGMDADSKLVISWLAANRDADSANIFMEDVAKRLANRVQLTTDGHRPYLDAVDNAFEGLIDYAVLVKLYGESDKLDKKYSPAECIGIRKNSIFGAPR